MLRATETHALTSCLQQRVLAWETIVNLYLLNVGKMYIHLKLPE